MRLWIDTDVGDNPDDAVALLAAIAHPSVELVGVSTTGGRTEWRVDIARQLVDVMVVPGEHPDELTSALTAAQPDALLAIGPLTNVASLVMLRADLAAMTVMGGALEPVRHRGRLRRVESNFGRDPAAAAVVIGNLDVTLVPLDVTVAMPLEPVVLERLLASQPQLVPEVERWVIEQDQPVVLHDPLAFLVAIGEAIAAIEERRLLADAHDGALRESPTGREQQVVVRADTSAAIDRIMELLA